MVQVALLYDFIVSLVLINVDLCFSLKKFLKMSKIIWYN